MCNCLNERKADISRDLAIKHNVISGVSAIWANTKLVSTTNKQHRYRAVEAPTMAIIATYTQTTTVGKPFKNATVENITIKPIHCMLCGVKL